MTRHPGLRRASRSACMLAALLAAAGLASLPAMAGPTTRPAVEKAAATRPSAAPVTTTPGGKYLLVHLKLTHGLRGGPGQAILALRDGRLVNVWFITPQGGDQRLHVEKSDLRLDATGLRGRVIFRTAIKRDQPMRSVSLSLNLALSDGEFRGTSELSMEGAAYRSGKGGVTGWLQTSPRQADTLADGAAWPSFGGPHGDMSTGKQPALVKDIADARPVWRSEACVPTGYGNAPDDRYFTRALISGNGGGGGSPVVAGDMVYVSYYLPNLRAEALVGKNPFWQRTFPKSGDFEQWARRMNATDREADRVRAHFGRVADDHVVAIDVATGRTKWHTVLPLRSPNIQTHKHRGTSAVPRIAGDILFAPNLASRLYALDARTGRLLWEFPAYEGPARPQNINDGPANPSPLVIGQAVIWARSGKIRFMPRLRGVT